LAGNLREATNMNDELRQHQYEALRNDDTAPFIRRYLRGQLHDNQGGTLRHEIEQRRTYPQGGSTVRRSPKPLKPAHLSGRQFRKLRKQAQKIVRAA
jgi:hypothetical protein